MIIQNQKTHNRRKQLVYQRHGQLIGDYIDSSDEESIPNKPNKYRKLNRYSIGHQEPKEQLLQIPPKIPLAFFRFSQIRKTLEFTHSLYS